MTASVVQIVGVAVSWWLLYGLNEHLFAGAFLNEYISWVFLPAALRLVAVLLFGWSGVAGLFLGAWLTQDPSPAADPFQGLTLALISAVAPWAAAQVVLRAMAIPRDLAGLSLPQLAALAAASSATSVALHHAYLVHTPTWPLGLQGLAPMFIGDLAGMLILGYLAAWLLRRWR
jgi:hypothetical protein